MITRLLALRSVAADGTSHGGFRWPLGIGAIVEAPDWVNSPRGSQGENCGGGLHGLPWGIGNGLLLSWEPDAIWMVVEVDIEAGAYGCGEKCRFRRCTILYVGERSSSVAYLVAQGGDLSAVPAGVSAATGYRSSSAATGDGSSSAATGNRSSSAATGDGSSSAATGYGSSSAATGYGSSSAATGYGAVSSAVGYGSRAAADDRGVIVVAWHDGARKRLTVGYVGEDGIKPRMYYRCDDSGRLIEDAPVPESVFTGVLP